MVVIELPSAKDGEGAVGPITTTRSGLPPKQQPGVSHTAGSTLAFTPMTLAFQNLVYTVTLPSGEPIDLLKGIDGFFKPGMYVGR